MKASGKVVFLGGVFLPELLKNIESESKIAIEYAADTLQKSFLRGLVLNDLESVTLVNLPFVGPFPRANRRLVFPSLKSRCLNGIEVKEVGFINALFLRNGSRYRRSLKGLQESSTLTNDVLVIVYSAHIPFLKAALDVKKVNPQARICLILPDFIEFMGIRGLLSRFSVPLAIKSFYRLAPKFDYFAVLTEPMAERLGIGADRYVVMEGIYDPGDETAVPAWPADPGPTFIYTGTLAARYGILDLLSAFSTLDMPNAKLWICGDGDARAAVEDMARRDARVTFFGRVPRAEALALQAQAHVMVNPRRPEGEFTRFSFPSKTMEYLASARPVIMHWLDGMPPEYRPYLMTPATGDAEGLAAEMRRVAALPPETLQQIGAEGRHFVLTQKNPKVQVGRLLDMVMPTVPEHPTDQKPR